MGLYSDDNEAALARVVAHARIGTAKFGIQLAHAGRKASSQRPWEGGGPLKAGQDPGRPRAVGHPVRRRLAHSAGDDLDDIARVREAFVNAAKRAVRIGFDLSSYTTRTAI